MAKIDTSLFTIYIIIGEIKKSEKMTKCACISLQAFFFIGFWVITYVCSFFYPLCVLLAFTKHLRG